MPSYLPAAALVSVCLSVIESYTPSSLPSLQCPVPHPISVRRRRRQHSRPQLRWVRSVCLSVTPAMLPENGEYNSGSNEITCATRARLAAAAAGRNGRTNGQTDEARPARVTATGLLAPVAGRRAMRAAAELGKSGIRKRVPFSHDGLNLRA